MVKYYITLPGLVGVRGGISVRTEETASEGPNGTLQISYSRFISPRHWTTDASVAESRFLKHKAAQVAAAKRRLKKIESVTAWRE